MDAFSKRIDINYSLLDDDQDEQKIFKFEFFTGGTNQKCDLFVRKFDFQVRIGSF